MTPAAVVPVHVGPEWTSSRRFVTVSLAAAVVGLVSLCLGFILDARGAWFAYLGAWTYVTTITLGGLILLMVSHAAKAGWMVVTRRINEALVAALPLCLLLFFPLAFGLGHVYPWAQHGEALDPKVAAAIAHKRHYLDPPFFLVRTAVYFALWIAIGALLRAWSIENDRRPSADRVRRMRVLGGGGLPIVALSLTWASFDWTMSLEPEWSSTIFGLYYFSGAFVGAIALVCVMLHASRHRPPLWTHVTADHAQAIGRLLFAMVCFWAYQAFSQLLIYWIGDVPEEIRYYQVRTTGSWWAVSVALVFGHFCVPFFVLIHRGFKRRSRNLAIAGGYMLLMHLVDIYWLVIPSRDAAGARPHWVDLAALLFVAGLWAAWIVGRYFRAAPLPQHDPNLAEGLGYEAQI